MAQISNAEALGCGYSCSLRERMREEGSRGGLALRFLCPHRRGYQGGPQAAGRCACTSSLDTVQPLFRQPSLDPRETRVYTQYTQYKLQATSTSSSAAVQSSTSSASTSSASTSSASTSRTDRRSRVGSWPSPRPVGLGGGQCAATASVLSSRRNAPACGRTSLSSPSEREPSEAIVRTLAASVHDMAQCNSQARPREVQVRVVGALAWHGRDGAARVRRDHLVMVHGRALVRVHAAVHVARATGLEDGHHLDHLPSPSSARRGVMDDVM
jgi:hypothetical protein